MKRIALAMLAALCLAVAGCNKEQAIYTPPQDEPAAEAVAQPDSAGEEGKGFGAVYLADNTALLEDELYLSTEQADECVMLAKTGGVIKTRGSNLVKAGESPAPDSAKSTGVNAAAAAMEGGSVELRDSMVTTGGAGAAAVYSGGEKATASVFNGNITTVGECSPALSAAAGGMTSCNKLAASTSGDHSPGVYAMAGGYAGLLGAGITTHGQNSPAVFASGKVNAEGCNLSANGSEGLVIEGAGSFSCIDTLLAGSSGSGAFIYRDGLETGLQGMATMSMTGGSISSLDGALIHVTNTSARISLQAVTADAASGIALYAAGGSWGESGRNGGHVTLTLRQQTLTGDIVCDGLSTVYMNMQNNTAYTGVINGGDDALLMDLAMDDTSVWDLTGDSYITAFTDEDTSFSNIKDNGNNIYYDATLPANDWLEKKEHALQHGGRLMPVVDDDTKITGRNAPPHVTSSLVKVGMPIFG